MENIRTLSGSELEELEATGTWDESLAAEEELERRYQEAQAARSRHAHAAWKGQHNARLHRGGI
jgi:hypothetical protein